MTVRLIAIPILALLAVPAFGQEPKAGERRQIPIGQGAPDLGFRYCSAGDLVPNVAKPMERVSVSGFYIAESEVSQRQFFAVLAWVNSKPDVLAEWTKAG